MIDERSLVGWEPRVTFRELVRIIVDADLKAAGLPAPGQGTHCLTPVFQEIKALSRSDDLSAVVGPYGQQMFFITSDQELGLSRSSTFQDTVIIIVGCHDSNPLDRCNHVGNRPDRIDPNIRLFVGEAEFLLQNAVKLGQDERGDK